MAAARELSATLFGILRNEEAMRAFNARYDEFVAWLGANMVQAQRDAQKLRCKSLNVYDAFVEWILLDSFEDVERIPSALAYMLSWTSESASAAVIVSFAQKALDQKIAQAKSAKNQFQVEYYQTLRCLTRM